MAKIVVRVKAPKQRNLVAKAVRDPNGPYRPKVVKNKIKKTPKYNKFDWD